MSAMDAGAAFSEVQLADGPIGFTIADQHGQGGPVVFISSDPQQGKRTLVIQNNTADPVLLATSSLLKLYLWPLLTDAEIGGIRVATSGWAATQVAGEDHHPHLEISPTQPVTLEPETPVMIELDGMLASGAHPSGRVRVAYNFGHMTGAQRLTVMLLLPPTQARSWPLMVGLGTRRDYGGSNDQGRAIYMTPWAVTPANPAILNTFVLQISATDILSFNGAHPRITVSFLSGGTDWSLCSDDQITAVDVDIAQNPGQPWTAGKDTTGGLPVFNVTPQPGTTTFNMDGPLAIRFSNLATTLPSGLSSRVLIQFTGLRSAGYDDGFAVVDLDKTDPIPHVRSFAAYLGDTEISPEGSTSFGRITVKWDVFAAENCLLLEQPGLRGAVDAFPFTPDKLSYTFTLQPQIGNNGGPETAIQFSVTPPVVNFVRVHPDAVAPGGAVGLSWDCSNGDHCIITADNVAIDLNPMPLSGIWAVPVGQTDTTYTVKCIGATSASGTAVARVPPVDASISASMTSRYSGRTTMGQLRWNVTVSWTTQFANTCSVVCTDNGQTISTALSGSWSMSGETDALDPEYPFHNFQIVANGRGTVQKSASC